MNPKVKIEEAKELMHDIDHQKLSRTKIMIKVGDLKLYEDENDSPTQFLIYFFDVTIVVADSFGKVLGVCHLLVTDKDTDHIKLLILDSKYKKKSRDLAMLSVFLGNKKFEVEQFFLSYKKGKLYVYGSSEDILGEINLVGKKKIENLQFFPNEFLIPKKIKSK